MQHKTSYNRHNGSNPSNYPLRSFITPCCPIGEKPELSQSLKVVKKNLIVCIVIESKIKQPSFICDLYVLFFSLKIDARTYIDYVTTYPTIITTLNSSSSSSYNRTTDARLFIFLIFFIG